MNKNKEIKISSYTSLIKYFLFNMNDSIIVKHTNDIPNYVDDFTEIGRFQRHGPEHKFKCQLNSL